MPGGRRRAVAPKHQGRHNKQQDTRRWFARPHASRALVIVVTAVAATAIMALAAVITIRVTHNPTATTAPTQTPNHPTSATAAPAPAPSPSPTPPPGPGDPTSLEDDFTQLANSLHAKVGMAVSAVGDGQPAKTFGAWSEGPAWSTIKVPLVIAAYRQQKQITDAMRAAITESDNASAESVWGGLGDAPTAAHKVEQILRETGDPTTVESKKVRPEFTIFGQTIWSLVNQVKFIASASCNSENDPVFDLMGQIAAGQSWGLGEISGTKFKGGWGPSRSNKYLVRQIGVLTTQAGKIAVAIAAEPDSGSFNDGVQDLKKMTDWLTKHLGALPVGQCGS